MVSIVAWSQDISNRGTDFWVGYGSHVDMYNNNGTVNIANGGAQDMILYFTSARQANVKVEIPATGWSKTYVVDSNTIKESDPIPKTGAYDARLAQEGISNKGIHITSDQPIAAYCHIYSQSISGASVILPTNILGQDYYALGFTQKSNEYNSYSYCFVIAIEDSTLIEVTPSVKTIHHKPGETFTQMLMKGEVLNLMGKLTGTTDSAIYKGLDLTGTHIRSISSDNRMRKRIAVFCGSGKISILCNETVPSADNLIAQMFPSNTWGKKYISVPTVNMPVNFFRVLVKDKNTRVKVNGVYLTALQDEKYYEFKSNEVSVIEANKNIMVAQYITTANHCGNTIIAGSGDPEIIYLSPVDQSLTNANLISPGRYAISEHHINVIVNSADIASFVLDGAHAKNKFKPVPALPEFSYAVFAVKEGYHMLHADSGLNVYAYGYGFHESYGYNAGFYNRELSNSLTVQNPYAAPKNPQTCIATPFSMSVALIYQPKMLEWNFFNDPRLSPNAPVVINNPVADSIFVKKGLKWYVYKLPGNYLYSDTGTLFLNVDVVRTLEDGGTSLQKINYKIEVNRQPAADWKLNYNTCSNDTLYFIDNSNAFDDKVMQWNWQFADSTYSTAQNPVKKYNAFGDYNVHLQTITEIGCFTDTVKTVSLNPVPAAMFNFEGPFCTGNTIKFTDASTVERDNIYVWNWDFGGGAVSKLKHPEQPFKKSGEYKVKLTVTSNKNCSADTSIAVTVYDYPQINIPSHLLTEEKKTFQIKPEYTGHALKYKWKPFQFLSSYTDPFPIFTAKENITYKLSVTGKGECTTSKKISIKIIHPLEPANAFSPNGDGINDTWVINNLEYFPGATVEIFNRSGQKIFSAAAYNNSWNGTYNGEPLPVATYYYTIKTKDKAFPLKTGYVAILR